MIEGMESTLSVTEAVKKFVTKIKKKYKERRFLREEQLLSCKSEKLVRLELVERERLQGSKQRGSGDDKVARTPLAYADLFKVESGKKEIKTILIDGDAGIGKTTFCTAISEDWGNGEILQEFELLLLLPLREQEVASVGSLLDLIKLFHPSTKVCDLVKDYFEEDEGKILVIADGWDELSKDKRKEGSFLYKFFFGTKYSSVSALVTSRPSVSAPLHLRKCIDQYAEIRGFDKEHIVEYINSEFDKKTAHELLENLESNPLIESLCSVPLNCVIICHLWRELEGDLPTTMTGLYTKIILNVINRNIQKFPAYKITFNLTTFYDLPEALQDSWWKLCEFAFQSLKKNQLVFTDKELKDLLHPGLALDDNILCFGLLQFSLSSLVIGCGRSFHFLHLTFQEYLAAFFLVKQECSSQVDDSNSLISRLTALFPAESLFTHTLFPDPHSVVLRFFFGIVFNLESFRSSVGQSILTMFPGELYLCDYIFGVRSHFLWAFEAQNDRFTHIVAEYVKRSFISSRTVHQFVAVVYVIANTPALECKDMNIDFEYCGLCDSHITALADTLANKKGKLQVKKLYLSGNELTDRGVNYLFHKASAAFRSLKHLDLGWNRISGEGVNSALPILAEPFNKHHQLGSLAALNISGSLSSDVNTNAEFILALGHCCSLRVLNLSANKLHASSGRALGNLLPQLVCLEYLNLNRTNLGDKGITALAQSLDGTCRIRGLCLIRNDIHATGISHLADCVCAGRIVIKDQLELSFNPLCLEGATAVIRLLSSEHFQAHRVYFERCSLTTVGGGSTYAVSRSSNSITCVGIREWICSQGIKANSVKELFLHSERFTGEGIHLLAGFMCLCPELGTLFCYDCEITSEDLKQLLLQLSQPILNLKIWFLSSNYIDDDGVSTLIEHLSIFPSLTHINVDDNNAISPEMSRRLEEICKERKMVHYYHLSLVSSFQPPIFTLSH